MIRSYIGYDLHLHLFANLFQKNFKLNFNLNREHISDHSFFCLPPKNSISDSNQIKKFYHCQILEKKFVNWIFVLLIDNFGHEYLSAIFKIPDDFMEKQKKLISFRGHSSLYLHDAVTKLKSQNFAIDAINHNHKLMEFFRLTCMSHQNKTSHTDLDFWIVEEVIQLAMR